MKIYFVLIILMFGVSLNAQEDTTGDEPVPGIMKLQKQLVDVPTAGVLGKGQYEVGLRAFANGGLLANINVGMTDRFMIGISYGGEKFIGTGEIKFNPLPGVDVRYRIIDENVALPAVAIGFNSQGYGPYIKRLNDSTRVNRYSQKSPGLFAVASKNYAFLGTLGFHGGLNWSVTEKKDKDNQPNFFAGIDKSINKELSAVCEYSISFNDNKKLVGYKRGYLNTGAKLNFNDKVLVEFYIKDLFNNSKAFGKYSRELRLSFINSF